jgi:hypothetical protein
VKLLGLGAIDERERALSTLTAVDELPERHRL